MRVVSSALVAEFLDLIRQRASTTPEGEWIRTAANWQELNLRADGDPISWEGWPAKRRSASAPRRPETMTRNWDSGFRGARSAATRAEISAGRTP